MRAFVFAIGGTGARVLTSMVMQFAAGVRPKGFEEETLTVVPIIVDPHEQNAAVLNLIGLLNDYRTIRKKIYDDKNSSETKGFYSVKIETLKEIASDTNTMSDTFFFSMGDVSGNTFDKYIRLNDMDRENQMFMQMLFSKEELSTRMKEGFYGSPNIGTIALSEFKNSPDFKAFRSAVNKDTDRIFFIGSIFGGTGAAGLPLFISTIRDLAHRDNDTDGSSASAEVPIGALIVMPYFALEDKEGSEINENHFLTKTRSALRYYVNNLNSYVNAIYYIADKDRPKAFPNDPGQGGQSKNKAHMVEFIGATALCDFLSMPKDKLSIDKDGQGRRKALTTIYKWYTLRNAESDHISFVQLPSSTNEICMLPLMKFELLKDYMSRFISGDLREPFASRYEPKIETTIFTPEMEKFFNSFSNWSFEMTQHGANAHNLDYFSGPNGNDDYTRSFPTVEPKKRTFGSRTLKVDDIRRALNDEAQKADKMTSQFTRFFHIADKAIEKAIKDNLSIENL